MGYGYYEAGGRPAGHLVLATCDKHGCGAEIDRGLGYLCGDEPEGHGRSTGCGGYFCSEHLAAVGPRGGCRHRGRQWGQTLSDLVPNADGSIVCCDRIGHDGDHAWARNDPA